MTSRTESWSADTSDRALPSLPRLERLPLIDQAALVYLAFPVLVFLVGWLNWWVGLPIAVLLVLALGSVIRPGRGALEAVSAATLALVALTALGWSALGGAGHLFFANFDWLTRDAVLRDLVVGEWPVGYERADGLPMLLRAPIAYYLPAALVGKVLGVAWADMALYAWTALGVALFLAMAVARAEGDGRVVAVLAVMVLFSGMDLVGTVLRGGLTLAANLTPLDHLEWWGQRYQYSSNTTQLFWVPNHALPGWLATLLLLRNFEKVEFMRVLPVVVALLPLWSPLTAVGFLPFAAIAFVRHLWIQAPKNWLAVVPVLASISIVAVTGLYLTHGAGAISSGATRVTGEPWWYYVPHHLQFFLLEAGILWLLLMFVRRDMFLWLAGLVLLLLPALSFGPSNDLVMRASIPALVVLALAAANTIQAPALALRRRVLWPIVAVLLLGVPTALTEITRAIVEPAWKPDLTSNVVEKSDGYPSHYVTELTGRPLVSLLRPVRIIPSSDREASIARQELE